METKRLFESNSFISNDYEAEQNFRETCLWYESKFSKSYPSSQAYQKYINNYHKAKSLYQIIKDSNDRTSLIIYNTESGIKDSKILKPPKGLISGTCITLLPNGELFCFCKFSYQDFRCIDKAFIIGSDYKIRALPYGLPLFDLSAIYFNSNVYCFGGREENRTYSKKFNLNENRWISITPMPKADADRHSVIFNENILICGYRSKNLLLYSVDIDSFSTISCEFSKSKRKILINAERLYLIECFGYIYESEAENEFAWKKILYYSFMQNNNAKQFYCLYNKGKIYISVEFIGVMNFEFDLKKKQMLMDRL